MHRSARIVNATAVLAAALALTPSAFADTVTTPDNRADRTGPAGLVVTPAPVTPDDRADRTGPAGMRGAPAVIVRSAPGGFHWLDAAIGAAGAFGIGLGGMGLVAALRGRDRELAA
jgi:hypothetical protein